MYAIALAAGVAAPARAQVCPEPAGARWSIDLPDTPADMITLEAGEVFLDAHGVSTLEDGVLLRYAQQRLATEQMRYDHPARQARVDGALRYQNAQTRIEAGAARLALEAEQAEFDDTRFMLNSGGRGRAAGLQLAPDELRLQEVVYTTCGGDDPAWALHGERIEIDADRGQGTARNVALRFFDVPLLYVPWFRFPVGDARQTGLLYPKLGSSDSTGFFLRWPVYLNLHPQADLTLTPEWMAARGLLLGGEARGLWRRGEALIGARYLAEDDKTGERRAQSYAQVDARLFRDVRVELDYADVSDIDFLRDLGQSGGDSATTVLERRLELSWRPSPDLLARTRVVDFQLLTREPTAEVFAREPEVALQYRPLEAWHGLRPLARIEVVRFSGADDREDTRSDALAGLRWEADGPGWSVHLGGQWRVTDYQLDDGRSLRRDLPTLRAGAGLRFRRPLAGGLVQTLPPRLDYIYTPHREQDALPVFDTSLPDFSLDQLRASNRFSGIDRISDESTLVPSIESSLLDPASGIRRARLRVGLQLRLADSEVTLPGAEGSREGSSDWLAEVDVDAANGIRGRAAGQYNTQEEQLDALTIGGRYIGSRGQRLQLAYRFRRELFEQFDTLALWPLGGRWSGAARWTWSVEESRSLETLTGLSYQSCCWGVTAGVRRFVNGSADDFDTGVFVQLAFKGLGQFGRGFGELVDRDTLSF